MSIAANRPLRASRTRAWIARALGWWIGELRGCADDLARRLARGASAGITIEAGERYWILRQGQQPIGQVDWRSGEAADCAAAVHRLIPPQRRHRPIIVEIPSERGLAKTVGFPADARPRLDRILEFEIARHFPFPAERVYFRHRLIGRLGPGDALTVEIVAVPRETVDGIRDVLGQAGLRIGGVAVFTGAHAEPVFLPIAASHRTRQHSSAARPLAFAAMFAAIAAAISWPLAQQARLAAIERELAALKPQAEAALRAGEAQRREAERTATVLRLRNARPPLVAVLDRLSRDVPDGSWLLSLSIAGREVVMDGLSPSAATIALALEKSRDVTGIVFRSPITRDPTTGLEHFQLGATLPERAP
jgi:general secretion pathway protein L